MVENKKQTSLNGLVKQSDKQYFTLRMQVTAGKLTVNRLEAIKKLAATFGRSEVHLTTRQGLEIPWLKIADVEKITQFVDKYSLKTGSTGPKLRNVNACPGNTLCRFGLINSPSIAENLTALFGEKQLPAKLKAAVSGCPNSCAKPQINDLGLLGVVQPRLARKHCTLCGACTRVCKVKALTIKNEKLLYNRKQCVFCGLCVKSCTREALLVNKAGLNLYVGGCVGRKPRLGHLLASFLPEETAFQLIEKLLKFYAAEAVPGERLGQFIQRLGLLEFQKKLS